MTSSKQVSVISPDRRKSVKGKVHSVINQTATWKLAVGLIEEGKDVTVELDKGFAQTTKLRAPVLSFYRALYRYVAKTKAPYQVILDGKTIYAVRNKK